MNSKYFLFIFFLSPITISIIEDDFPKYELELDNSRTFNKDNMTNNELYIFSKNSISGVLTYDIDSPVLLNLSYGTSNKKESIPTTFDEGHNENITDWKTDKGYKYFFSIPVLISDDDTYTFIKIKCSNDNDCIQPGDNISVKLVGNYTWKISIFILFYFLILLGVIFSTCYFARNCLTKCCNFRVDLAAPGAQTRGQSRRRGVRAAPAQGGHVPCGALALKARRHGDLPGL